MKVALLNPPSFDKGRLSRGLMGGYGMRVGADLVYPPMQLAYVAAVLEQRGHAVEIVDAEARGLDAATTLSTLERSAPEIVGVPLSKDGYEDELGLSREIRRRLGRRVCSFGPMAATHGRELVTREAADFVLIGEADVAFADLVDALAARRELPTTGLVHRRNGEIVAGEGRHAVGDLDTLPFPARHLLDNALYRFPGVSGRVTAIHSSRGCPIECPFCPYVFAEGSALRQRSPEKVVDEMWQAHRDLGIETFVFRDPVFTLKTARAREICRLLTERPAPFKWMCETTLGSLSEELLGQMAQAGCIAVSFGVESANEALQRKYGRNKIGSLDHAVRMVGACRRLGLRTRAFFMIGFPEETPAMVDETVAFALRLDPDTIQFVPVTAYRGTPLDEEHGEALEGDETRARRVRADIRAAYRRFYARPSRVLTELTQPRRLLGKLARYRGL